MTSGRYRGPFLNLANLNPRLPLYIMEMKTKISTALLVCLAAFSGCKDDNNDREVVKPSENPITTFIAGVTGFEILRGTMGPWEFGVVFSASVPGKITQLGSQMPDPGNYRVLIWEWDTQKLTRQKTVEQTTPGTLALANVEPLAIEPNKKYVISINSSESGVNKAFYYAYKIGAAEYMPFTIGNILIQEACYKGTSGPEFPSTVVGVKYELYGYPEFTFIPD